MPGMSARIKVKKGRKLNNWPEDAPTINIDTATGSVANGVTSTAFTATATDTEDGDISANVVWTTVADGNVQTGGTGGAPELEFTTVANGQTLTASITDSWGQTTIDTVLVDVT